MVKNVGSFDKKMRLLVGIVLAILGAVGEMSVTVRVIILVIATAMLVTGTVGFCPVYKVFDLSTVKK